MNSLCTIFDPLAAGILTAVLTTAPVNADAAARGSAEERDRRAGIPACNAAGTAYVSGEEAIARAFGRTVRKSEDFYPMKICDDKGFLRFVPRPVRSDLYRRLNTRQRSVSCNSWAFDNDGIILSIETTPENEAADREQAALYAATIEASPQFQYVVDYVNKKQGKGTVLSYIISLLWVGPKDTLDDKARSQRICGWAGKLWDITAPRKQVAAAVNKSVARYLLGLSASDLITIKEYDQLRSRLAEMPALGPRSP